MEVLLEDFTEGTLADEAAKEGGSEGEGAKEVNGMRSDSVWLEATGVKVKFELTLVNDGGRNTAGLSVALLTLPTLCKLSLLETFWILVCPGLEVDVVVPLEVDVVGVTVGTAGCVGYTFASMFIFFCSV